MWFQISSSIVYWPVLRSHLPSLKFYPDPWRAARHGFHCIHRIRFSRSWEEMTSLLIMMDLNRKRKPIYHPHLQQQCRCTTFTDNCWSLEWQLLLVSLFLWCGINVIHKSLSFHTRETHQQIDNCNWSMDFTWISLIMPSRQKILFCVLGTIHMGGKPPVRQI